MSFEVWLIFCTAAFFAAASPGPSVIHAIRLSGHHSFGLASASILGNTLAILAICTISSIGLSFLNNPYLLYVLKVFGAFYLIYIGVKSLVSLAKAGELGIATSGKYFSVVKEAILISITNPKIFIFIASFFPQFLNGSKSIPLQLLIMTITFAFFTSGTLVAYSIFSKLMYKNQIARNAINKGSGVALILFGLYTFYI